MTKVTIKVLEKASAVLDCLADGREHNPSEIAEAINEPRPSVYRLLDNLQALGLVERAERRGTYRLGFRLFTLGNVVRAGFSDLRAAAVAALRDAHEQSGQTLFLCVRRGEHQVCVERLEGVQVQVMIHSVGGSYPLYVGATGRILLANAEPEFITTYLDQHKPRKLTDATIVRRGTLVQRMAAIREQGYEISDEDTIVGIAAIGAPVRDHDGVVNASVSIAGPRPVILEDAYERQLALIKSTAAQISRRLGYRAEGEA